MSNHNEIVLQPSVEPVEIITYPTIELVEVIVRNEVIQMEVLPQPIVVSVIVQPNPLIEIVVSQVGAKGDKGDGGTWGDIAGNITEQADLQAILDSKVTKGGDSDGEILSLGSLNDFDVNIFRKIYDPYNYGNYEAFIKISKDQNNHHPIFTFGAIDENEQEIFDKFQIILEDGQTTIDTASEVLYIYPRVNFNDEVNFDNQVSFGTPPFSAAYGSDIRISTLQAGNNTITIHSSMVFLDTNSNFQEDLAYINFDALPKHLSTYLFLIPITNLIRMVNSGNIDFPPEIGNNPILLRPDRIYLLINQNQDNDTWWRLSTLGIDSAQNEIDAKVTKGGDEELGNELVIGTTNNKDLTLIRNSSEFLTFQSNNTIKADANIDAYGYIVAREFFEVQNNFYFEQAEVVASSTLTINKYVMKVSGTTTINNFEPSKIMNLNEGAIVFLSFEQSLTLTESGNIRSFSGGNISTIPNQWYAFLFVNGGNWKQLFPSPNQITNSIPFDNTQNTYYVDRGNNKKGWLPQVIFSQTSIITLSNTNTEISLLGSGVGSPILEPNELKVGKTIRIKLYGFYSRATGNLTLKLKLGNNVLASDTGGGTGMTNEGFTAEAIITCHTTGVNGSVYAQGYFLGQSTSGAAQIMLTLVNTSADTIDTTTNLSLDFTAQFDTADIANTITTTNATVEILG